MRKGGVTRVMGRGRGWAEKNKGEEGGRGEVEVKGREWKEGRD